jgi:transcriptional regulator with XRE-family HTH domain
MGGNKVAVQGMNTRIRKTKQPETAATMPLHATLVLVQNVHGAASEIARISGINKGHVSRMIRGLRPPSAKFRKAIAPALLNLSMRLQAALVEYESGANDATLLEG